MALAEQLRSRPRRHDAKRVVVRTAPGGVDRHVHCALFDAGGDGKTSRGPDGHVHQVEAGRVIPLLGHTHEFSAVRCELQHDQKLRHREKP